MSDPAHDPYAPPQADLDPSRGVFRQRVLPFMARFPILVGALAGLLLRGLFSGGPGSAWSAMAGAFIFAAPMVVGAVTVYLAERQEPRTWAYYLYAPAMATMLFVGGSLITLFEGLICAILIVPVFGLMGALGGLVMGAVCRFTGWPKQVLAAIAMLPVALGVVGDWLPAPTRHSAVERSLRIEASPETVWAHLHAATDIRAEEVQHAWAFRIGAPMPQSGVTRVTPEGRVRETRWGRQVRFEELIADEDWEPARRVRWIYRFSADSFPPGSLDDHVVIGGHYFDLVDTSYTLRPDGAATVVIMRANYRLSTQFNVYADLIAQWLLGDFGEVILGFYKTRSEAGPPPRNTP